MTNIACPCGCGKSFEPVKKGGRVKKFATPSCKSRIESAVRRWGMKAFQDELIGIETLKPFMPGQNGSNPSRATEPEALTVSEPQR